MNKQLPTLTFGFAVLLFASDVALGFAYAMVPVDLTFIRGAINVSQFIMMTITMLVAINWMTESF